MYTRVANASYQHYILHPDTPYVEQSNARHPSSFESDEGECQSTVWPTAVIICLIDSSDAAVSTVTVLAFTSTSTLASDSWVRISSVMVFAQPSQAILGTLNFNTAIVQAQSVFVYYMTNFNFDILQPPNAMALDKSGENS